eukprot:969158-Alexandrium_andersonii.AAC.1
MSRQRSCLTLASSTEKQARVNAQGRSMSMRWLGDVGIPAGLPMMDQSNRPPSDIDVRLR